MFVIITGLDYIMALSFLQQVLFKCGLLNDVASRSDDVDVQVMNWWKVKGVERSGCDVIRDTVSERVGCYNSSCIRDIPDKTRVLLNCLMK
jgi:hypothetical protein